MEDKKKYRVKNFFNISEQSIENLKSNYKIINVDYINPVNINYIMFKDEYFNKFPDKINVVKNMTHCILNDENKHIYTKKTDYLCDLNEKICICNKNADLFRKIYDGINYKENKKFVAWMGKNK